MWPFSDDFVSTPLDHFSNDNGQFHPAAMQRLAGVGALQSFPGVQQLKIEIDYTRSLVDRSTIGVVQTALALCSLRQHRYGGLRGDSLTIRLLR